MILNVAISVLPMATVNHYYLRVYLCASSYFKCSFSYANISCYRSFNSIFGKLGRLASEEAILHLDAFIRSDKRSLDFVFARPPMKFFKSRSINDIDVAV